MMLRVDSTTTCPNVISLNELEEVSFGSRKTVALTDYQSFGDSFQPSDSRECQLLVGSDVDLTRTEGISEKDFVLVYQGSRNQGAPSVAKALEENRNGFLSGPDKWDSKSVSDEFDEAFGSKFPDLDYRKISTFRVAQRLPVWCYGFIALMGLFSLLSLPWSFVATYRKYHKDQTWRDKLDDDRTEVYRKHPHAMRLVGATEFLNGAGPIERPMDLEFDVALSKEVKRPKTKRWTWILVSAFIVGGVGGLAQFYFLKSSPITEFLGEWSQLIAILFIGGGVNLLIHSLNRKNVAGQQELPLETGTMWTRYRESAFYQYHDRVLNELGFRTVGHFRLSGAPSPLARTIYLSPRGNVLVELGVQSGREFFTIESVTNNEKFLETHSMVTPSHEKTDIYQRHLRNSASHEDIVQALEEHDAHVGRTIGSGYREAMFTEERFPRFIAWATRTSKEDEKLKGLGETQIL